MRIKASFGYWIVDRFPVGREFERAGRDGVEIERVMSMQPVQGCNAYGYTKEGKKVCFNMDNVQLKGE